MKVCGHCEQPMPPGKRPHAVYCSRSCKGKAFSKRNPSTAEENKVRYQKEKVRRKAYAVEKYWDDPETSREYSREYRKNNPDVRKLQHNRRRTKKAENGVFQFTVKDWSGLLERFNHKCFYCGKDGKLTMDHVIPISRGGVHSIGNIVPCCGFCNSSKRDRTVMEWRMNRQSLRQRGTESGRAASSTKSYCGTDVEKDNRRQMVVAGEVTGLGNT